MIKKTKLKICIIIFLAFLVLGIFGAKILDHKNKIFILTDVEYLQYRFPNIEGIKNAKYYYKQFSSDWEIGLVRADYCGIMEIEEDFSEKLKNEYKWDSADVGSDVVDNLTLIGEDYKKYTFLYCEDFCDDQKYITRAGDFYFDPVNKIIYFRIEFS